jgi:ribosomal protein S12 methylthiotransferase
MPKAHLVTLGCPKNTVDSERMYRKLELGGYEICEEADAADVIIVNTCGFIEPAKEESIGAVMDAADLKSGGACRALIVTGCLAQRYQADLAQELAEADLVIGLAGERDIVLHCDRLLGRQGGPRPSAPGGGALVLPDRHLLTPSHWGYLRISDGCDRACSFCAIPGIRGGNRSETVEALVAEARQMTETGVKEIALISQDTMRYGADIYGSPRLAHLIRELLQVDEIGWLRLLYTYPTGWRDDLIDLLAQESRLCGYVDMPIQHASDPILKAMNRGCTRDGIRRLVGNLRDRIPDLTVRTSVIVGYPGEGDTEFRELVDFVEELRFNRLVAFSYSHEDGTAAGQGVDDVPEDTKRDRINELMEVQRQIASEFHEQFVGQRMEVLVDRAYDGDEFDWVGRTRMDAPEIDGEVFVTGEAQAGEFATVTITESMDYDLIGSVGEAGLLSITPAPEGSETAR